MMMMMQLSKRSTDKYTHATNETDCKKEQQNSRSEREKEQNVVSFSAGTLLRASKGAVCQFK